MAHCSEAPACARPPMPSSCCPLTALWTAPSLGPALDFLLKRNMMRPSSPPA
eukprot:CAMPEP_0174375026 /NCGR_PEP_ID=MMETSP0811_2-20130205/113009_1 /TAXON_ID=73025 ORGANISM="Eutreptiella gymnastica-like, Strain CCMP1594" /NCGR_SAMPLE_ID=MMETSP0811_2 /ASSEMBLY_ACC=CAM_ASM_000667 /LENGTH=51 /DNA_ID=CAMNT_0015524851 /DNA_START=85 /DNA_END=237 /DNA_ORIENTATION=-